MTRPETQRELRAAIERGATMRLVPLANGASLLVVDDPPTPDPRTAHGPAWSAGTPRTEAEAREMLSQVEPRHALRDRMHHRMQRTLRNVVLEPSPRVEPGEPMPEATMPRAEWRATWRAAEVPPLCALRERCEASGATVLVGDLSAEGEACADERYTLTQLAGYLTSRADCARRAFVEYIVRSPPGAPTHGAAGPYDEPRGWCAELASQT